MMMDFAMQAPCDRCGDGGLTVQDQIAYTVAQSEPPTCEALTNPPETDVFQEPCPTPVDITFEGCQDTDRFNAGDVRLDSLGRILQLDVTLKNICPGRRVALAIVLTEVDDKGKEFKRGLKTILVPAQNRTGCRDILVKCVKFVLPEALDVSGDTQDICNRRKFRVRLFANYIDNDFHCCDQPV